MNHHLMFLPKHALRILEEKDEDETGQALKVVEVEWAEQYGMGQEYSLCSSNVRPTFFQKRM